MEDKTIEDNMKINKLYLDQNNDHIQDYVYQQQQYYTYRIPDRKELTSYEEVEKFRNDMCNPSNFKPHAYQSLLGNFINPSVPFTGIIVYHGLGSGKTISGINISERFIPQCQKYKTQIVILVSGSILKQNWKNAIMNSTGEKYMKYIDKTQIADITDKKKQQKMAMSLIMQNYKFMSYKSFYKHVLGERILDKDDSTETKGKNVYRKNEDGEFERDVSVNKIFNLNNTLLIIDEAHQITGNAYGDAVRTIIDNSVNLKVVLMSATPMKNLASDIVSLINFLRPKSSPMERDKAFSGKKNYLMEMKEGGEEYIRNMARGYVSYVKGADSLTYATKEEQGAKPKELKFTKVTRCLMDDFQKNIYNATIDEQKEELEFLDEENEEDDKKDVLDRKSEAICNFVFPGLSIDKKKVVGYYGGNGIITLKNQLKENKKELNKLVSKMLYDNTDNDDMITLGSDGGISGKIFKLENLKRFSSKFHTALTNLNQLVEGQLGAKSAFIYSNLVGVGINLFKEVLINNGYLEYQKNSDDYNISSDTICYFCGRTYENHRKNVINDDTANSEIQIHKYYPATFITVTGKTVDDQETLPEEKKKILDDVFNSEDNKNGKHIKFVLGSKVMNEGVSLMNIGEVHILDVSFNLGRVEQAVGRGIRYCSHWRLMSKTNMYPVVRVFKYVIGLENNELSTEEELYKKAEIKHLLVKKVERILKEVSIDCPLMYNGNLSLNDLKKYKNCEKESTENDIKCPAECDYMDCEYKCADNKLNEKYYDPERKLYKKINIKDLDKTTFTPDLVRYEIDSVISIIKQMYIVNVSYTLPEIIEYVKNNYDEDKKDLFDEYYVYKGLDELIPENENDFNNFKNTIVDKFHNQGYLIYRGDNYIFQSFNQNQKVSLYYRTHIKNNLSSHISLYNYLKLSGSMGEQIGLNSDEIINNIDVQTMDIYDFDSTMEYYDNKEEYKYVGIIDKELNRGKTKDVKDINDVFKIREKRDRILEKRRAVGLTSFKGAVCSIAKDKKYLEKLLKNLEIDMDKNETRENICKTIEKKMLDMEKYGDGKLTYVMIPANHPVYKFPYNLIDRTNHIKRNLEYEIKLNVDISIKKEKKSYVITIKNNEKMMNEFDTNLLQSIIKKYEGKEITKNKVWEILID